MLLRLLLLLLVHWPDCSALLLLLQPRRSFSSLLLLLLQQRRTHSLLQLCCKQPWLQLHPLALRPELGHPNSLLLLLPTNCLHHCSSKLLWYRCTVTRCSTLQHLQQQLRLNLPLSIQLQ